MADAGVTCGGEIEPEQLQRTEKNDRGLLGVESSGAAAAEDNTQNGGRSDSTAEEALLVAATEEKPPPNLSSSQRKSSVSTAHEQQQLQQPSDVLGGPPPLPKPPEDLPIRRNFQIPRKSREKKGCSLLPPLLLPLTPLFILFIREALYTLLTAACKILRVWRRLWHGSD